MPNPNFLLYPDLFNLIACGRKRMTIAQFECEESVWDAPEYCFWEDLSVFLSYFSEKSI